MKKILALAMLLISVTSISQYSSSEINTKGYLDDFDIVVDIIRKQHPNPYRFYSKDILDKKIDSLRKIVEKNPTYINFHLNSPIKLLGDGHSTLTPDSNYLEDYFSKGYFFPLMVYAQNGKFYVNHDNQYNVEIGSRIIEINNQKIEDIFAKIPFISDGFIKVEDVDVSQYISMILGNNTKEYQIKYETTLGKEKTIKLKSIDYRAFNYNTKHEVLPIDVTSELFGIYGYQVDSETYYLSVRSFNYNESFFYDKLKKYFQEIRKLKSKKLILDVRNNSGGLMSNVPLLYSFLSKELVFNNIYKYGTKVVDINYKDYLIDLESNRYYSETEIRDQNNYMRQRFDKSESSDYYYGNSRLEDTYIKSYPRDGLFFDGKVVLLINNKTFSSATYFSSLFKSEKRGSIVGKETGSCSNFTTAAWFINYKLPNSKTNLSIPRIEVFFNSSENDNIKNCTGVKPDFRVKDDSFLKALTSKKDPELENALLLLSKD